MCQAGSWNGELETLENVSGKSGGQETESFQGEGRREGSCLQVWAQETSWSSVCSPEEGELA